jgi:hypothetical protein
MISILVRSRLDYRNPQGKLNYDRLHHVEFGYRVEIGSYSSRDKQISIIKCIKRVKTLFT